MDFAAARAELVRHLRREIKDERVLAAMARVPRERFVPPEYQELAYEDQPLPIDFGQTISQPTIVAMMTEALELSGREKVLEVGTGSGYQAAVLAEVAAQVITVERIPALAEASRVRLAGLGYAGVTVHTAIETLGWPPDAPYDAIIVTAAAPSVPPDLLAQVAIGGRLVIPVGPWHSQILCQVTRGKDGPTVRSLGACRFVWLIGRGAWEEGAGMWPGPESP